MSYPADFYETLVAAASQATRELQLPNQFLDMVYTEYTPNWAGAIGQKLAINVPDVDVSNASDIGSNGITPVDPTDTKTEITIAHKYSSNRKLPTFHESLSANNLAAIYVGPIIEEVLRRLDSSMCSDLSSSALDSYDAITGGADTFTRANLAAAWGNLRAAGVPVNSPANTFFMTHSAVVANMLGSTEFHQESVVGVQEAEATQQRAMLAPQLNFRIIDDPYMPVVTTGVYGAIAAHRYFYGLRTVTPILRPTDQVMQTVVFPRPKVPVVVERWYEPKDQAYYMHAFVICGHGIVRKNLAQWLQTT